MRAFSGTKLAFFLKKRAFSQHFFIEKGEFLVALNASFTSTIGKGLLDCERFEEGGFPFGLVY